MVHECYEKHKEKLQKESRERYKIFSEKEKTRKAKKVLKQIPKSF